jgi:hypothetical protein
LEDELLCRGIKRDNIMIDARGHSKRKAPKITAGSPSSVSDIGRHCTTA